MTKLKRIAIWALLAYSLIATAMLAAGGLFCRCGCGQLYCHSTMDCIPPTSAKAGQPPYPCQMHKAKQ